MAAPEETLAMRRALQLAALGGTRTFPNPLVGAVLLKDGQVVGEGFHECCGGPHAEVMALEAAGDRARGATLVVTLEPCNHTGRTGPCVPRIVAAGVTRVVASMEDPDPRVSGSGFRALGEAGLDVETGPGGDEARVLNRLYLHYRRTGRSLLRLKMAVTLDGRTAAADGSSRWITGPEARARVLRMRAESSAVLVGAGTVRSDNPSLLPGPDCKDPPVRMVACSSGALDTGSAVFDGTAPVVVALRAGAPAESAARLRSAGAEVWELPAAGDGIDPVALLERTASAGMGIVLCEGGARLATSLVRAGVVDEAAFFVAAAFVGGDGRAAFDELGAGTIGEAVRMSRVRHAVLGDDILVEGEIVHRTH